MKKMMFIALAGFMAITFNSCEKEEIIDETGDNGLPEGHVELEFVCQGGTTHYSELYVVVDGSNLGPLAVSDSSYQYHAERFLYNNIDLPQGTDTIVEENTFHTIEIYDATNDSLLFYSELSTIPDTRFLGSQYAGNTLMYTDIWNYYKVEHEIPDVEHCYYVFLSIVKP
jgi:hypothetical protein